MNDPVADLEKAQKALAQEESAVAELEQDLNRVKLQREALEEEIIQQRRTMHQEWYADAKKRYPNFDIEGALLGNPTAHEVKIGTAVYHLMPPPQQRIHDVARWVEQNPGTGAAPGPVEAGQVPDPAADYGPVTDTEVALMQWLHSVGAEGEERRQDIAGLQPPTRITLIRRMLPTILNSLADACADLQGYMNLAVGHELGNF